MVLGVWTIGRGPEETHQKTVTWLKNSESPGHKGNTAENSVPKGKGKNPLPNLKETMGAPKRGLPGKKVTINRPITSLGVILPSKKKGTGEAPI